MKKGSTKHRRSGLQRIDFFASKVTPYPGYIVPCWNSGLNTPISFIVGVIRASIPLESRKPLLTKTSAVGHFLRQNRLFFRHTWVFEPFCTEIHRAQSSIPRYLLNPKIPIPILRALGSAINVPIGQKKLKKAENCKQFFWQLFSHVYNLFGKKSEKKGLHIPRGSITSNSLCSRLDMFDHCKTAN